jgi:predicted kinase
MPNLFDGAEVAALDAKSRQALVRIAPLLEARGRMGLVRRIHGDLHLGNIALIDGRPTLFDAVEFDPLIASGDVLYDLAFLLMDLEERGLRGAANIVLNRYLAVTHRSHDIDALAALPLFLSLRAAIRAKVTAAKLLTTDAEPVPIREAARKYFRCACAFINPGPPQLVAVGGLSGTGKSLLAAALAPELAPAPGALVLRSDVERKALFGSAETERLNAEAYRPEVDAQVYAVLADKARRAVAAGHSAIADAVYARASQRRAIAEAAGATAFSGLFLQADFQTRLARVGGRRRDASDADVAIASQQESYDLGLLDWHVVDASGTPAESLACARAALAADLHPERKCRND